MSCKAFNGRIVLEYLSAVSRLAASRSSAAGPNRLFGSWLMQDLRNGHAAFPENPLIPLQAAALFLELVVQYFTASFKSRMQNKRRTWI